MNLDKKTFILLYSKQYVLNWKSPIWLTRQLIYELSEYVPSGYKFSIEILKKNLLNKNVMSFASVYENQPEDTYQVVKNFYMKLNLDLDNKCIDEKTATNASILIFNSAMKYIPDKHFEILDD